MSSSEMLPSMPDSSEFSSVADLFKLLGDSSRLKIFWILCHWEACVTNISERAGMTSPAVSHHLKFLKASQLITSSRKGKEVYYRAADTVQAHMVHDMIKTGLKILCPEQDCFMVAPGPGQTHVKTLSDKITESVKF